VRTTLRWLGTIAAALLCVVAVGACGGEDDGAQPQPNEEGGDGDDGDDGDGDDGADGDGADGNDGDDGDGDDGEGDGVPASPIDIPPIQVFVRASLDEVRPEIERKVTDACGGEMCLVLRVEMRDVPGFEGFQECEFIDTDPPAGSQVERGGTLIIVMGTEPCVKPDDGNDNGDPDDGGDGEEGDSDATDDEPTDDEPTDDEPTDDTETTTEGTP
jgi:hypothetical protein